jgi:uncharacterized membrane protein YqjE
VADRIYENEKSIAEVLREMKSEALDFINTRYELLAAELREKSVAVKKAVPMLAVGLVFGLGTFAVFTFMLVAVVCSWFRAGFPNGTIAIFAWPIAALIIFVIYGGIAGAFASAGIKRLREQPMVPERTIRVLKQDQQWIQNEAADINNTRAA